MSAPTPSVLQQKFGSAKIQAKSMNSAMAEESSKASGSKGGTSSQTKKAFVRSERLMQNPFRDDPALQALRDSLPKSKRSSTESRTDSGQKSSGRTLASGKKQSNNRYAAIQSLKRSGLTNVEIAKKLGVSESTVYRALQSSKPKQQATKNKENN